MANKLPWFTHDHDARNDDFIRRAEDQFGHFGYSAYFKMLEVLHEHGTGDTLRVTRSRLCLELRSRWPVVREVLDFFQESGKVIWSFGSPKSGSSPAEGRLKSGSSPAEVGLQTDLSQTEDGQEVILVVPMFRKRQAKLKSKIPSTLPEDSLKTPIEGEGEGEGEGEEQLLSARSRANDGFKDIESKQPLKDAFHVFMDGIILDYLKYRPGDSDPAQKRAVTACYKRYGRAGRDILALALGDPVKAKSGVDAIGRWLTDQGMTWTLDTCIKWFPDWVDDPKGFGKNNGGSR